MKKEKKKLHLPLVMNFQKLLKNSINFLLPTTERMSFRFGIFENPNITSPLPLPTPANSLVFLLPQRSLGFADKPLSLPPDPSRPEDGGGRGGREGERAATRFWRRAKERGGGGGDISKWSDDEYE